MDENTRKKVLEIIKKSIDEVVYDEVKQIPERFRAKQEQIKKTKAQREQETHEALFGGKEEEINYRLQLHESTQKPKITPSELDDFEKQFKSRFPNIIFEKQNAIGQNGQIIDFPVINEQKDAFASGKIIIGKDSIGFSMSLINGFKIKSIIDNGILKEFEIKPETKDVFGKVLNLYEELFKKRFNDIINPKEETEEVVSTSEQTPVAKPVDSIVQPPPTPMA